MELHGRLRQVVLDYDGTNERALTRMTLYRLGVPARLIEAQVAANSEGKTGPRKQS